MADQLIPRIPKRKRQPTAEMMREQLRLAADEIMRLRAEREPFEVEFHFEPLAPPLPPPTPPPEKLVLYPYPFADLIAGVRRFIWRKE